MESFVTMITPYKQDGTIDFDTALKYVEWYYRAGLTGIFSICQSSEIFYLSLEERIKLNEAVYKKAKELERAGGRKFTVVSSGHISDDMEKQAEELNAVYESGTDVLILITNRLAKENESDDVFINNAGKLVSMLPKEAKLGFYECPYPYKRLLSPRILDWCIKTNRFYYLKDTCCNGEIIKQRCGQLKNTDFKLLNANCQTLLSSMKNGSDGYCGIMANFHPKLYVKLCENYGKNKKLTELLQSFIGIFGFIENALQYPLTAKYNFNLCGIPTNISTRKPSGNLDEYAKNCVKQMKLAAEYIEERIEQL